MACKAMLTAFLGASSWTRFRAGKFVVNTLPLNEILRAEGPLRQKVQNVGWLPRNKKMLLFEPSAPLSRRAGAMDVLWEN